MNNLYKVLGLVAMWLALSWMITSGSIDSSAGIGWSVFFALLITHDVLI